MPRRPVKDLIEVPRGRVLCQATVELLSIFQRPYLFSVTVIGLPPHAQRRVYEVAAPNDMVAAQTAMKYFERDVTQPQIMQIVKPTPWH